MTWGFLYFLFVWHCLSTGSIQTCDICLPLPQRTETEEMYLVAVVKIYISLEALSDVRVGDPNLLCPDFAFPSE